MTLRGTTKNAKSAKVRGSTPTLPSAFSRTDADKVPLWSVTTWDKHFNNVDKARQPSVIKYHYYLAADLEPLVVPKGDIKILTTNVTDLWTNEEKVKGCVSEGEVVSIPWGGKPNIQYYKGRFVTSDNRIATSSDLNRLNNKYLYYFMMGNQALIGSYYRGASLKHPEMAKVLEMPIPLPPLPTQQRIVDELDQLCALKKNAEDRLSILGQIAKSLFVEVTTPLLEAGQTVELNSLVEEDRPITYGILKPGQSVEGGIPVVKVKDFPAGEIDESNLLLTSPSIEAQYKRSRLRAGDLLISIRGSVGRMAQVPSSLEGANITQDTARLTIRKEYNPIYVRCALETPALQHEMERNMRGVAIKGINIGFLRKLKIPVPSRKVQDDVAAFRAQLDKSRFALRETIATLDQLYRAKLQEYFG